MGGPAGSPERLRGKNPLGILGPRAGYPFRCPEHGEVSACMGHNRQDASVRCFLLLLLRACWINGEKGVASAAARLKRCHTPICQNPCTMCSLLLSSPPYPLPIIRHTDSPTLGLIREMRIRPWDAGRQASRSVTDEGQGGSWQGSGTLSVHTPVGRPPPPPGLSLGFLACGCEEVLLPLLIKGNRRPRSPRATYLWGVHTAWPGACAAFLCPGVLQPIEPCLHEWFDGGLSFKRGLSF